MPEAALGGPMGQGRTFLAWVGGGCLVIVFVGLILVIGGGYFAYRAARQIGEQMKDPVAREAKAEEILGVDNLPEGYHAALAFAPFSLIKMVVLTDEPPNEKGECEGFEERGFIYMELIGLGSQEKKLRELRDYFEGKTDDASVLEEHHIDIDVDEQINRGVFDIGNEEVFYANQRGTVGFKGETMQGITSLQLIDCPGDERMRFGIWFTSDPDPAAPVEQLDLTGTAADPEALESFLEPFHFCS